MVDNIDENPETQKSIEAGQTDFASSTLTIEAQTTQETIYLIIKKI